MSRKSAGPFIGALLRLAWRSVRDQIDEAVRSAGYHDVSRAHISAFRYPTMDGSSPGELADEMRLSKQTVNGLLLDLERWGYLRRIVDPDDKRRRVIRLTAKGLRLENTTRAAAREAEIRLESELGRQWVSSFRQMLKQAALALNNGTQSGNDESP